jgi:acyl transferase domain-containing protein
MSTTTPTALLFSGQGSQYFHMGRELFDHEPGFRARLLELDRLAQELLGRSIVTALYDEARSRSEPFQQLLLSHPAIFMVELALAQTLSDHGIRADCAMGVSLGSFAASVVCGCLTAEEALRAVVHQAKMIIERCPPGVMIAVLASPEELSRHRLMDHCELAAVNSAAHCVIAAPAAEAEHIESRLSAANVGFQRLPVNYAFHSRWIDAAASPCRALLESLQPRRPSIPLVLCAEPRFVDTIQPEHFWIGGRSRIQLREAICLIERSGPYRYIDVGPGGTLATVLKHSLGADSSSQVLSIMSPFGGDLSRLRRILGPAPV